MAAQSAGQLQSPWKTKAQAGKTWSQHPCPRLVARLEYRWQSRLQEFEEIPGGRKWVREARSVTVLGSSSCKFTSRNPSRISGKGQEASSWFWWAEGRGAVRTLRQAHSPGERALRFETHHGGGKAAPHLIDSIRRHSVRSIGHRHPFPSSLPPPSEGSSVAAGDPCVHCRTPSV